MDRSWRCHEPTGISGVPEGPTGSENRGFSKSFGSRLRNSCPITTYEVSYKASRSCASNATAFVAIRPKLRAPGVRTFFFLAGIDRSWRCHEPTGAHGVSQDPKIADFRSLLARICAILVRSSSLRCHTKRLGRALRTRHHLLRSDKNCEHPARATIFLAGDRPILEVSRTQCHVGTPGRGGGRSWGGGGW